MHVLKDDYQKDFKNISNQELILLHLIFPISQHLPLFLVHSSFFSSHGVLNLSSQNVTRPQFTSTEKIYNINTNIKYNILYFIYTRKAHQ